jgi:hypothetical protein
MDPICAVNVILACGETQYVLCIEGQMVEYMYYTAVSLSSSQFTTR